MHREPHLLPYSSSLDSKVKEGISRRITDYPQPVTSRHKPSATDRRSLISSSYGSLKPHERNPGKMTFTTASGLLPAGIAVYVQRGCAGINRHVVGDERALQERRPANPS